MYTSYFLDSENLNSKVLQRIENLDKSDKMYFFWSKNSQRIEYDIMQKILNSKCKIEFVESTIIAPNALDFCLISTIGYKIGAYKQNKNTHHYVILSKDKGYDAAIQMWKEKGIHIKREFDLLQEDIVLEESKIIESQETKNNIVQTNDMVDNNIYEQNKLIELTKYIQRKDLTKEDYLEIFEYLKESKTKQEMHNKLQNSKNKHIKNCYHLIYKQIKKHWISLTINVKIAA